jgi:hypothetical protein
MRVAGRLFQTAGISALPLADQSAIREKVETFNTFTPDNDPHGERDFGAFEHNGERIFWKVDYYAPTWNTPAKTPPIRDRPCVSSPSCSHPNIKQPGPCASAAPFSFSATIIREENLS